MKTRMTYYQYPELKKLDINDSDVITQYAEIYNQFSCEFSFPSLYLWDELYHYQLTLFKGWLIIIDTHYDFILMPMGNNITPSGLLELSKMLRQDGYSGDISNVPPEIIEQYPQLGQYYDIEADRGEAEYIYLAKKLFELSGKKLRKKKNHISQFRRSYPDYQVRTLDSRVRKDCQVMVDGSIANRLAEKQKVSRSLYEESMAIKRALDCFNRIHLDGIAIYSKNDTGEELVGFSIYSRLNQEVYTIHFEKVNYHYHGAAQLINWETAKVLKNKCKYINREQDLGIPGLRKSKLSYEPELIYPANYLSLKD